MSAITSHVLDTSIGRPAVGLEVRLGLLEGEMCHELGRSSTDHNGRVQRLLGEHALTVGIYQLSFETGAHYRALGRESFYERVEIRFRVTDVSEHYHVPLLLSPFGYSTYRGS